MESNNNKKQKLAFFREIFTKENLSGGLENFVAVFPAIILMPIVINAAVGFQVFDIATVLFTSAVSSILYLILTKGKLPGYLGSSFAFIGSSIYIVSSLKGQVPQEDIFDYLMGAYIVAAMIFVVLAVISNIKKKEETHEEARKRIDKFIDFFIPPAVLGPAISLIGLELTPTAAEQSGLSQGGTVAIVAGITLFLVVFLSVTKRNLFKNSSLFLALIIGGIVASLFKIWDFDSLKTANVLIAPTFRIGLPKFTLSTVLLIIPPTLILFCEHIGRKIIIENLQSSLGKPDKNISLSTSLFANGIGNLSAALLTGVPTTIYAESTGVMRINGNVKYHQYIYTAAVLILCSFSGHLLALIKVMPDPVIGAISLFLMAIIAAPGLRVLVDRKVNYDKISTLLLTASVLVVGLSKMTIVIGSTELKGMSLGLLVGIIMNLFFVGLRKIKLLKEHLSADEVLSLLKSLGLNEDVSDGGERTSAYINDVKYFELTNSILGVSIWIKTNISDADCKKRFKADKDRENNSITFRIDNNITERDVKSLILDSREIVDKESKLKIKNSLYAFEANFLLDFAFEKNPCCFDALLMLLNLPKTNISGLIIQDENEGIAEKILDLCLGRKGRRINFYVKNDSVKRRIEKEGYTCELSNDLPKTYENICKNLLGKLNIVVVGSLTSLANAMQAYANIKYCNNIFAVAGDFQTYQVEKNIESDTHAAELVLESELPNLICFPNNPNDVDDGQALSPAVKAIMESISPQSITCEIKKINVINSGEAKNRIICSDDGKPIKIANTMKPEIYKNIEECIIELLAKEQKPTQETEIEQ
ncbi:MAG: hypothetical protein LBL66_07260 [Clostridiales bacterium]|jgi:uracil permease|nr:hypothetical protein [Clostridiales bacterium]